MRNTVQTAVAKLREKEKRRKLLMMKKTSKSHRSLVLGLMALGALVLASTAPVVSAQNTYTVEEPVETTVEEQVDLEYNEISFDVQESATSTFTFGVAGETYATYEIRNTDTEGGDFKADFQCSGGGKTVSLSDETYIQAGEVGTLEVSTEENVESCSVDLEVPEKTVRRTKTVMKKQQKTETVKVTILEKLLQG